MLTEESLKVLEQYKEIEVVSKKTKGSVAIVINTSDNILAVKKQINTNKADLYLKLRNIHNINLPEIYHLVCDEESITIIEEYIEGVTLEEMIQSQSRISENEFFSMIIQLCNALSVLHGENPPIIHRDIKPKNILYTQEQRLVLIDFDASREYKKGTDKDTRYLGTMEYAPPEQFGHSQTDPRSDIYSIGMTMSELVKNELVDLLNGERIQGIIDRCTMFDPNKRYQTIEEFEQAIRRLQGIGQQKRGFSRWVTALIGTAIVTTAVILFVVFQSNIMKNPLGASEFYEAVDVNSDEAKGEGNTENNVKGYTKGYTKGKTEGNTEANAEEKAELNIEATAEQKVESNAAVTPTAETAVENATIENLHIDFYKHETYMDDLKIYINYNDASQIAYLSLIDFGRIDEGHYYTDENLLIVKKEYLNTLPPRYYELSVGFNHGNPANMVFEVHDVEEESVYGEYRLSHYSKKYYTSAPSDFTLLVYDTNGANIKGLYHGKEKINQKYYKLEDNGIVVILDKSYMKDIDIGTIFDLGIELDDGTLRVLSVQVLERQIKQGSLEVYEFFYSIANPEDILIEITWNDSAEVTHFLPVAEKDPKITNQQYRIEGNALIISKDGLEGVAPGDYEWAIVYDTGGESMFRITVTE